jgi:hypothetical protein
MDFSHELDQKKKSQCWITCMWQEKRNFMLNSPTKTLLWKT